MSKNKTDDEPGLARALWLLLDLGFAWVRWTCWRLGTIFVEAMTAKPPPPAGKTRSPKW